LLAVIDLMRF